MSFPVGALGEGWPARLVEPGVNALDSDGAYHAWRDEVCELWRDRLKHSRGCLCIAEAITPHLLQPDLAPWTRDFLHVVWDASLDRVLLTAVDMLKAKRGVRNFDALRRELERRSRPASVQQAWDRYLRRLLAAARHLPAYTIAERARNDLGAHEALAPSHGVAIMRDIANVQALAEDVFRCFPAGETYGFRSVSAGYYPALVQRVVAGDFEGVELENMR